MSFKLSCSVCALCIFLFSSGNLNGGDADNIPKRSKIYLKVIQPSDIQKYYDANEIVLIALIDKYSPNENMIEHNGKKYKTQSHVMKEWLEGIRKKTSSIRNDGRREVNPDNTSIFLAEMGKSPGHKKVVTQAQEILAEFKMDVNIRSIPVIFLMYKGNLVQSYTYYNSAGKNAEVLIKKANELLNMSDPGKAFKRGIRPEIIQKPETGVKILWVIDDADEDYKHPPFDDTLTALDETGKKLTQIKGLNICATIGGGSPLAVIGDGEKVLTAEVVGNKVSLFSVDGRRFWATDLKSWNLCLGKDGKAYAVTSKHGEEELVEIEIETGNIIRKIGVKGGHDLVFDPLRNNIWIAGEEVYTVNAETFAKKRCGIESKFTHINLDYDADGSILVTETKHYARADTVDQVFRVGVNGSLKGKIPFRSRPQCVSINRKDGTFWVAWGGEVAKFNKDHKKIGRVRSVALSVQVAQWDETLWCADYRGMITHYSKDGKKLKEIPGFSNKQKWIALPETDQKTDQKLIAKLQPGERNVVDLEEKSLRERKVHLRALYDACKIYYFDNDSFPTDITQLNPDYILEINTFALPGKQITAQTLKTACDYEINSDLTSESPGNTVLIREKKGSSKKKPLGITAEAKIIEID